MAEQDAVDEGADGCLFVGVEVGEGFEAELPHVVGGGVGFVVEDELVGGGVDPIWWTRGICGRQKMSGQG